MDHKATRLEPEEFMLHFFPLPSDPPIHDDLSIDIPPPPNPDVPQWDRGVFEALKGAEDLLEIELSEACIEAIRTSGILSTRLEMKESQHRPDKTNETKQRIDAAFFRSGRTPSDGRPHWADQMVAVEFKRGGNDTDRDPFEDICDNKVDADAEGRKRVRGQLIDYAENIFRYQHRTALFMLLVIGRRCRFLRWDRSGTLVTRSMDYYEEHQLFCEMLWRMSMLDDERLGCDPSATRVMPKTAEYDFMNQIALPKAEDFDHAERNLSETPSGYVVYCYVRDMFCQSLLGEWPRYKLQVVEGDKEYFFLVGKPVFHASGMADRGTRGFVAWDCQRHRFVWLKDAWRAHYELVDQEGAILRLLNDRKVPNIPTVCCHGDVCGQTTQTPKYWEMKNPPSPSAELVPLFQGSHSSPGVPPSPATSSSSRTLAHPHTPSCKGRKRSIAEVDDDSENPLLPSGLDAGGGRAQYREDCPLRRHIHYRLVVDEVAMPLKEFRSGSQLLSIIHDCVVAHEMALTNAQIMHRDVSGGNILIYPRVDPTTPEVYWSGMLADWELSKPVSQQGEKPRARQPERTGTWQFMSVAILNDHRKVVETSDELESFFHVLLYYAVRYLRSNCTSAGVFIEDFFDSYNYEHGEYSSGSLKQNVMTGNMKLMTSGKTPGPLKFVSTPLNTVIHTILSWFNAFYAKKAFDADEKRRLRVLKSLHSPPSVEAPRKIRYAIPESTAPILQAQAPEEDEGPSMMNDKLATSASLHAHMRLALLEAISSTGWLEDRVEGDNVPANFEPRRPPGPSKAGRSGKMPAKKLKAGLQTDGAILSGRGAGSMRPSTPPRKWGTYF